MGLLPQGDAKVPAINVEGGVVVFAGFWKRIVAYCIDQVILSLAIFLVSAYLFRLPSEQALVYSGINPYRLYKDLVEINASYYCLFGIALPWLYFALFESTKKATPGKMLIGIEVVNINGEKVTFLQATLRYIGKRISGLILGIGYLMAAFTEKKQALYDLIAQTLVISCLPREHRNV